MPDPAAEGLADGVDDATQAQAVHQYAGAVLLCCLATALAVLLRGTLAEANLVLIYLLSVVASTVRFGRGPGILASVLAVAAFDLFLVEPLFSLSVDDSEYLLTFAIMLSVSLFISHLTANLHRQARMASGRARRADVQFGLSRELAVALTVEQISDIAARHLAAAFHGTARILVANPDGGLDCSALANAAGSAYGTASIMAQALFERHRRDGEPEAVSVSGPFHLIPLRAPMRVRGVLVLINSTCRTPEQLRLLQAFASQIALAIERVHYVDVARATALAMESERLRNSLLNAVSHDVRTPLTAIVGLSSTLAVAGDLPIATRRELAWAIHEDAVRMNDMVSNLLDLARLQTGGPHLNREWQMIEEVIGTALDCSASVLGTMTVVLSLQPSLPLVAFDAVLIERVLCNLLQNAARHAAQGQWIGIAATTSASELRVSVADRGHGVPDASRERIFAKFAHGAGTATRDGVGLGLSICRTIVDAHGGSIWVEPGADGGASFIFTLPLGTPPAMTGLDAGDCL